MWSDEKTFDDQIARDKKLEIEIDLQGKLDDAKVGADLAATGANDLAITNGEGNKKTLALVGSATVKDKNLVIQELEVSK